MKKFKVIVLICFFGIWAVGHSQYVVKNQEELNNIQRLAQEKVFVNHSGPMIFVGDYLYYSFTCFDAKNNRATDISKVGYVSLVNDQGEFLFTHKLRLDKGLGQGDFFINAEVPSGVYKLLGYTHWMKNNGLEQFFQDDLIVINPYQADQSGLTAQDNKMEQPEALDAGLSDNATLDITTDTIVYGKRSKVSLALKNYKGYLGNGYYTLRVKKKNDLEKPYHLRATTYAKKYFDIKKEIEKSVGDHIFLPEQRGELLHGKVVDKETKTPLNNETVVISIPGEEFLLKFATTNDEGLFYSYLQKEYKSDEVIVQLNHSNTAEIQVVEKDMPPLTGLKMASFTLDKSQEDFIKKRSIYNQIENQFFGFKPDSVLLGDPIDPFDGGIPEVFLLDEYTRFPTFQETLVEILNNAGYRNNGKGNDYIRIAQDFETFNEEYNTLPAIVVIDGVYIPNHEDIKQYDARKIKSISLIRDKFSLANKEYQGIMSVETFDKDYLVEHEHPNKEITALQLPFPKKNYYRQEYKNEGQFNRIPDYRNMLFWEPNIVLDSNGANFDFYTSDVSGEFEILLDGFTTYGKPISLTRTITVQ